MLVLLNSFRKGRNFNNFSNAANSFLIVAGGYLFLMQMHGYEHTANAEEYIGNEAVTNNELNLDIDQNPSWKDTVMVTIPARGDKEYKLLLNKGESFEYSWSTDGVELFYDFHGEPKSDSSGYFKSFRKSTDSKDDGNLTAIFSGTHGWYWKNTSPTEVVVTLKIKGEYQRTDIEPQIKESKKSQTLTTHDSIDSL
jgi:hypothetical protein